MAMDENALAHALIASQRATWELYAKNLAALDENKVREMTLDDGATVRLQCNPARVRSNAAKVDAASIAARPCFLCSDNRPGEQQTFGITENFEVAVNPYPILSDHLTILSKDHIPQALLPHLAEYLQIVGKLTDFVVFYNGPQCGASAPDHLHFQAVGRGQTPLEKAVKNALIEKKTGGGGSSFFLQDFGRTCRVFCSADAADIKTEVRQYVSALQSPWERHQGIEPRVNLLGWYVDGVYEVCVFPRRRHRPSAFYADGAEKIYVSPGALDMAGVVVTSALADFERLTATDVGAIYDEVSLPNEPYVSVGVVEAETISGKVNRPYLSHEGKHIGDEFDCTISDNGTLVLNGEDTTWKEVTFLPVSPKQATFDVRQVVIGKEFHWQQTETQRFYGGLSFIAHQGKVLLINRLPVEEYLESVISSEMSATASREFLKAHAVISRSWLLAGMRHGGEGRPFVEQRTADALIRWYERDAHALFDVCADDHCQRYQGILRLAENPTAAEAVRETRGEVLLDAARAIVDARFSKSCGGVSERFSACWADEDSPSLTPVRCAETEDEPDLTDEACARAWILSAPEAYCNTSDREILASVLNRYDQTTADFYRWTVRYTRAELSELVGRKTGIDFGEIRHLVPMERGASGRIIRLKIIGTRRTLVIGKELEIRRALSESHLYSSAFVAEETQEGFVLHGAGWGHGVGLCQIGAAMMAHEGHAYREILGHYYRGETTISTLY